VTARRVDANQRAIVAALRDVGASVEHLHTLGEGAPDLLVGFRGVNTLLEVKDGSKPPSRRRLTPDEATWHAAWRGQVTVVETIDEALAAIGAVPQNATECTTQPTISHRIR
jgi:hypothetical protein